MMRNDIFLRNTAWNFLIKQNICSLPVSASSIAIANNYEIVKYSDFALAINKPIDYIIDKYDNDGFVFWSNRQQKYIICYNEKVPAPIVRWTVMHEIAHIELGHVTKTSPEMTRIRKIEHPYFEFEADGFTRRVLCPSIVLHDCEAIITEDIMELCGISRQAAKHRSDYMKILEQRNMWRTDPLEIQVEKQFKSFIIHYLRSKYMYEFAKLIA